MKHTLWWFHIYTHEKGFLLSLIIISISLHIYFLYSWWEHLGFTLLAISVIQCSIISNSHCIIHWTPRPYPSCNRKFVPFYQMLPISLALKVHPYCCKWQGFFLCTGLIVQFSSSLLSLCDPMDYSSQVSLSITNSQNLLKLMSIESVVPSNHLILCHPRLLLPSIFLSFRVFSNDSILRIRWPKYWNFSFSISPSHEYSGLISCRIDWFDLLVNSIHTRIYVCVCVYKASSLIHSFMGTIVSISWLSWIMMQLTC